MKKNKIDFHTSLLCTAPSILKSHRPRDMSLKFHLLHEALHGGGCICIC